MSPSSPTFSKTQKHLCIPDLLHFKTNKEKQWFFARFSTFPCCLGEASLIQPEGMRTILWVGTFFGLVKHCTLSFYYLYVYFGSLYFEMPCSIFFFFCEMPTGMLLRHKAFIFSSIAAVFKFVQVNSRFRGFKWSSIIDTIVLSVGWTAGFTRKENDNCMEATLGFP